ncbi:MAG: dienelactone hydrolase family protein [Lentisphaerota bacterium]
MIIEKFRIGSIPAVLYACDDLNKAKLKQAVIMYHGSSSSKEIHAKELSSLADAGFMAIGIDNVGHGERKYPNFEDLFSHDSPNMIENMLKAVNETALELPSIVEFLDKKFGLQDKSIGILGISMGALIVYKALSIAKSIRCAVAILGTPKFCAYETKDYLKSYAKTCLISLNASKDQYISNKETIRLHSMLKKRYRTYKERFLYKEYPDSGHFMLPEDWESCWQTSISFLQKNLL